MPSLKALKTLVNKRVNKRLSAARKQILSIVERIMKTPNKPAKAEPKKKTEEKVSCQVCWEDFAPSDMDRHMEEVHVGSWFIRCMQCDEGFNFKTKYIIHLKNCPTPVGEGEDRLAFNK